MRPFRLAALCAALSVLPGCGLFDGFDVQPDVPGLARAETSRDVFSAFRNLESAIQDGTADSSSVLIVRQDLAFVADTAGEALDPARLALYANPRRTAALVAQQPLVALDLPQAVLVYDDGRTLVAFHDVEAYLVPRHGLTGTDGSLLNDQVRRLVREAAANPPSDPGPGPVTLGEGIVQVTGTASVDSTLIFLRRLLADTPDVAFMGEYNHQNIAAELGLAQRPLTTLYLAAPVLTAPLQRARGTFGVEAFLRLVVLEDAAGETLIAYNDIAYQAARHGLGSSQQADIAALAAFMQTLAQRAAALE